MRVQPTQNQNFGAIRLNGQFNNSAAMEKITSIAKDSSLEPIHGRNWLGFVNIYIKSYKGSAIEKQLVPQLREAVSDVFKVTSISNKKATRAIGRFENK
ncbi:MAG: hypothetical protein WCF95_03615 [bacterium]